MPKAATNTTTKALRLSAAIVAAAAFLYFLHDIRAFVQTCVRAAGWSL